MVPTGSTTYTDDTKIRCPESRRRPAADRDHRPLRPGRSLILDVLGYLSLDHRGAELLFEVLTEERRRASIAVGSNEPFSSWTKTFTDPRLCAGIVDRLT